MRAEREQTLGHPASGDQVKIPQIPQRPSSYNPAASTARLLDTDPGAGLEVGERTAAPLDHVIRRPLDAHPDVRQRDAGAAGLFSCSTLGGRAFSKLSKFFSQNVKGLITVPYSALIISIISRMCVIEQPPTVLLTQRERGHAKSDC